MRPLEPMDLKKMDQRQLKEQCETIFTLNRLVKKTKDKRTKRYVYAKKRKLIRFLYENGYCVSCRRNYLHTGPTVLFKFKVAGQFYTWHQPDDTLRFEYKVTDSMLVA